MACDFGAEPKDTSPAWFTYTEADLLAAIPTWGAFLASVILHLPAGPQNTEDFCNTDPPADLPTDTDWTLMFTNIPLALITGAYGRLRNQVIAWKYSELCQCVAGGGTTCWPLSSATAASTGTSGGVTYGNRVTPSVDIMLTGFAALYCGARGPNVAFRLYQNSGPTLLHSESIAVPSSGYFQATLATPQLLHAGTAYTIALVAPAGECYVSGGTSAAFPSDPNITYNTSAANFGADAYPNTVLGGRFAVGACYTGAPTAIDPPPDVVIPPDFPEPPEDLCTDAALCALQHQMDRKLDRILATVDLQLRTTSAFSYIQGPATATVTGNGTLDVAGILGVSVLVDSVPDVWGRTLDVPQRYTPKLGAIHFVTTDGLTDERQIHYDLQIELNAPPSTQSIAFSLRPGVSAHFRPIMLDITA